MLTIFQVLTFKSIPSIFEFVTTILHSECCHMLPATVPGMPACSRPAIGSPAALMPPGRACKNCGRAVAICPPAGPAPVATTVLQSANYLHSY